LTILLDSNACIAAIRERPPIIRERILKAEAARQRFFVSSIVVFELWYGIAYSSRPEENARNLAVFLTTAATIPLDDEDAQVAGAIRADLRRLGTEIGPYDCLIAAQAVRRDFLLVTANVREFSRVPGLRWENWAS
jgi:tRNA(fMet)-specific endonuclease VapC